MLEQRDDLWITAGGRLLTAHSPAPARRQLIARVGLPSRRDWPGVANHADLRAELAWIRKRNLAIQQLKHRQHFSAAVAVADGDGGLLAVGFHVRAAEWDDARVADLQAAVAELAQRLPS